MCQNEVSLGHEVGGSIRARSSWWHWSGLCQEVSQTPGLASSQKARASRRQGIPNTRTFEQVEGCCRTIGWSPLAARPCRSNAPRRKRRRPSPARVGMCCTQANVSVTSPSPPPCRLPSPEDHALLAYECRPLQVRASTAPSVLCGTCRRPGHRRSA